MGSDQTDYQRLASEILKMTNDPKRYALWNSSDCAEYLRVARKHFSDRMAKLPEFPQAVELPGTGSGFRRRRWIAREVIEWAESRKVRH